MRLPFRALSWWPRNSELQQSNFHWEFSFFWYLRKRFIYCVTVSYSVVRSRQVFSACYVWFRWLRVRRLRTETLPDNNCVTDSYVYATTGCKPICTNTDRHVFRRTLEMHGWSIICFWRFIFWKSLGTLECWMWSCTQDVSHLSGPRDPILPSTCLSMVDVKLFLCLIGKSICEPTWIDSSIAWFRVQCWDTDPRRFSSHQSRSMNNRHEDDPVFEFFEICISCNFCKLVFWRDSGMKKSARMTQKVSQRRQTTRPDVDEEPFMSSWAWWQASRMRSRVHRLLEWARNGAGSTAQDGTRKCPRGLPDWSSRDQRNHVWNFPAIRHRDRWKQDVKFCADTQIQSLLVVTETVQIQYHPSKVINPGRRCSSFWRDTGWTVTRRWQSFDNPSHKNNWYRQKQTVLRTNDQECHRKTCCEWDKHRTLFPSARKIETAFKGRSETTFVLSSYHLVCSPITLQSSIDVRVMSEIRLPTTPNVVSGIQRILFLPWQPRRSSTTHDRGRDFFVASASTTCVQDIQNVDTRGSWREWQAKWRIRSTRTSSITSTAVTASPPGQENFSSARSKLYIFIEPHDFYRTCSR